MKSLPDGAGDRSLGVDLIWEALKNEDGISTANIGVAASFIKQKSTKPRVKHPSQRFDIQHIGRPFDISDDYVWEKSSLEITEYLSQSKEATDACVDLIDGLDIDETAVALCDSDDEEYVNDNVEGNAPLEINGTAPRRLERVAKALGSDGVSSRVIALTMLNDTLKSLLMHCPVTPLLNYPPPYSYDKIKLNQNLPLVSDLVKPTPFKGSQSPLARPLTSIEGSCVTKHDPNEAKCRLQVILNVCGNALFRLVGDGKSEKSRQLSLECLQILLVAGVDFSRHMPYMIPAMCARYPQCKYDKDMEVFVQDLHDHEFYKRGGATDRPDRDGLLSQGGTFQVIEPNEELRLELCKTFGYLLRGILATGAERTLDAYYPEILLSLQTSLRDPFPDVKIEASRLLRQLLRVPHFNEQGANKYFAVGLARSALPNCRHRNTNVVCASIELFEASVCVPDRAKVKGAGSKAMLDLVGFREENALPVAAFYNPQCGVSVNTLAELACHRNHRVRLQCCKMLSFFLVLLPDRYDHHQRLLPYVLSFINDDMPGIQNTALHCLEKCGSQFECEHPDEVIERRQFGVDGDDAIDYNSNLPKPFTNRPSLGARLFVRANTSRFFLAMLGELSNWKEQTRKRSAELLLILAVCGEEHLTKDFQHTITSIAKAIGVEKSSQSENDHLKILEKIQEVVCLMSKYVDPAVYLPIVCPRIAGDNSSATSNCEDGSHSEMSRSSYAIILSSLIKGAPLHSLDPHEAFLTSLLSGDNCTGSFAGERTKHECIKALRALLAKPGFSELQARR